MWKPEIETEEKRRRLELLDLFQLHSVMKRAISLCNLVLFVIKNNILYSWL